MERDKIYLHSEMDEKGEIRIVDQFGRILCGLEHFSVNRGFELCASLTLTVHEYRDGKKFINEAKGG